MLRAGSQISQVPAPGAAQNDSCVTAWEAAYLRCETPWQEITKLRRRLLKVGAASWPRDARILDLFCGRGNGLRALSSLGFMRLEGLDRSGSLLARYVGPAQFYVGDARQLPFGARCKDLVIIQ